MVRMFLLACAPLVLVACGSAPNEGSSNLSTLIKTSDEQAAKLKPADEARPKTVVERTSMNSKGHYHVEVKAVPITRTQVRFLITTDVPPPAKAMVAVNLFGQKDQDVAIGAQKMIEIIRPTTDLIYDTSEDGKPLPAGKYTAEVTIYLQEKMDPETGTVPLVEAQQRIKLGGSGETSNHARRKAELMRWVMVNINVNDPWDEQSIVARLGGYEKSPSTLSPLHDAYYFPAADMTLIVNRLRKEITVWREGRATK